MGPKSSARRQQYFEADEMPKIKLKNGQEIYIKYLETYPASMGFEPNDPKKELHINVAEELKEKLKGRTIGQNIDSNDEFFECLMLNLDGKVTSRLASFKLQNDEIFYFIELLLIS